MTFPGARKRSPSQIYTSCFGPCVTPFVQYLNVISSPLETTAPEPASSSSAHHMFGTFNNSQALNLENCQGARQLYQLCISFVQALYQLCDVSAVFPNSRYTQIHMDTQTIIPHHPPRFHPISATFFFRHRVPDCFRTPKGQELLNRLPRKADVWKRRKMVGVMSLKT